MTDSTDHYADDTERKEGLWDGAQLVIYTTDENEVEAEPCTEWGEELGVVSYSLWARFEDDEREIPLYQASETGAWFSLSARQFHPDPAERVSDAFIEAVCNMVDEDVGDGWGDPTEEVFNEMRDVEKQLWHSVQWAFLKMESPEAAGVIDWCKKQSLQADTDRSGGDE